MFIEADHTTSAAPVADGSVSTLSGNKPGHKTIRLVVANPDRKQHLIYLSAAFCQVWPEWLGVIFAVGVLATLLLSAGLAKTNGPDSLSEEFSPLSR